VSFTVGTTASPRTFGPLDLAALVRYAGASADFQPLHFDDAFAKSAGFPGPIVHGMLSAGLIGTYLGDWVGVAAVRRIRVRFHHPVPMGATVVVTGSVVAAANGTAELELALTADGTRAVSASATVELDRLPR
jgi:acyl dehydratase